MESFFKLLIYRGGAAFGTLLFTLYTYSSSTVKQASMIFSFVLIIYIVTMISRFGLDILTVKDVASLSEENSRKYFSKITNIIITTNCLLAIVFLYVYFLFYKEQEILFLSLNIIPFSMWMPISCYFRARDKNFFSALFEPGTIFLITTLVLISTNGLLILEIFTCINWVLLIFSLTYLVINQDYIISLESFRGWFSILKLGFGYMALSVFSYVTLWLPAFFIKSFSSGYFVDYNLAVRLIAPFTFIITTVDFFLSTRFAKNYVEKKYHLIKDDIFLFRKFFTLFGTGYLLITSGLLIIAKEYEQVTEVAFNFYVMILTGYLISSIVGPYGTLLNMSNKVRYVNYGTVSAMILVLILIYPVSLFFGVNGVVMLISISIVTRNIMIRHYAKAFQVIGEPEQ